MPWKPLGGPPPNLAVHLARKASSSAPETYGPERYMPTPAAPAFSGKVSASRPSAPIRIVSSRPGGPSAWSAMKPPSGSKIGKYRICGALAAILVRTPVMSVSPTLTASYAESLQQVFADVFTDLGGTITAQLVVGELGRNRALEDVIVGGAEVTLPVV